MIFAERVEPARPAGVTLVGAVFLLMSGLYLAFAMLAWAGVVPLARGVFLLGAGLETRGPVIFLLFSFLFARAGFGLLRMSRWSRRLAIILAAVGVYLLVPTLSSAVAEVRLRTLALDGLQVIVRVAIIWYLLQSSVKEAFV